MTPRAKSWHAGLATAVLLAYLLPEWAAYWRSEVFVFVNGWDEETYLSWQGVLGSQNEIGYYVLHLYGLLHEAGLSGAIQNLLSDTVFPIFTAWLVAASLRLRGIDAARAFAYAVLILFSSTLFNYANPIIKYSLGEYDGAAGLMAGWELYPSILRTPNPQVSFFLIAFAVYAWLKWRKFWLLLLPLPVLYYFVAVPYVFMIAVGVAFPLLMRGFSCTARRAVTVSALGVYVAMALGGVLLFTFAGYYDPDNWVVNNAWVFAQTRTPQMPIALLFMLPLILGLWWFKWLEAREDLAIVLLILILAALATVNLHVFTGFMLSQKNYYDYGLSILFGLMLVVVLEMQTHRQVADGMLLFLLAVTAVPTLASHFYFYQRATTISAKAAPLIDAVRRDPLHAIIPDLDVSSRMAYSTAKLLAPPFSYQYYFPFIEKQCSYYPGLLASGFSSVQSWLPESDSKLRAMEETVSNIRRGQVASQVEPYKDLAYCHSEAYRESGFSLLSTAP